MKKLASTIFKILGIYSFFKALATIPNLIMLISYMRDPQYASQLTGSMIVSNFMSTIMPILLGIIFIAFSNIFASMIVKGESEKLVIKVNFMRALWVSTFVVSLYFAISSISDLISGIIQIKQAGFAALFEAQYVQYTSKIWGDIVQFLISVVLLILSGIFAASKGNPASEETIEADLEDDEKENKGESQLDLNKILGLEAEEKFNEDQKDFVIENLIVEDKKNEE